MFGFRSGAAPFFMYFLALYLTLIISESIGLIFAMTSRTAELAIVFMSIQFIVLLSLTGFLTATTPVYYEWVEWINFLRCARASSSSAPGPRPCRARLALVYLVCSADAGTVTCDAPLRPAARGSALAILERS
jgi:ABC-2 type transporter